jgi:hypothetical protein
MAKNKNQATAPKKAEERKPISQDSFWQFLNAGAQRKQLLLWLGLYLVLYIIYQQCYQDPLCIPDTLGYITSSIRLTPNLFRPMGYSYFIALMYKLSPNIGFIIFAQYWLSAITVVILLLSIKYLYPSANTWVFNVFALCIVLSPTISFMNLWILSDALFFTLMLVWLITMLFVIERESITALVVHVISLFCMIYVRHTGLIFPIISCLVFISVFGKRSWYMCLLSIAAMLLVINNTRLANRHYFGAKEFSAFASWNQANNAISILPYVTVDTTKISDPEVRMAHRVIRRLNDTLFSPESILSGEMIWRSSNSLGDVQKALEPKYGELGKKILFFKTGDVLGKYSSFLITHYPFEYLKHFVIPNAKVFFYFDKQHQLKPFPKFFLKYKDLHERYQIKDLYYYVQNDIYDTFYNPFASIALIFWLVVCIVLAVWLKMKGKLKQAWQSSWKFILALLIAMVVYIGFSVTASVIVYRYMYPVAILMVMLAYMLLRQVDTKAKRT